MYLGITEGTIGEAGVGLDYGGVGGGLWGFDAGMFQVGRPPLSTVVMINPSVCTPAARVER